MCAGGTFLDVTTGKMVKVFFPVPNVHIPVIAPGGEIELCQWGQRKTDKDLLEDLPITGWARYESLEKYFWKKHNPKKVLIPFRSFFEKDRTNPRYPKNKATEFTLEENQKLGGYLIEHNGRKIVYSVTKPIENWIHDRYPVIV